MKIEVKLSRPRFSNNFVKSGACHIWEDLPYRTFQSFIGEVRMQKTFTSDFLTGRRERNCGPNANFKLLNNKPNVGLEECFNGEW